jgi:DNA repair protein SbcC/Rad50
MIPLQLQIKNFLSYGPSIQTIDFSPHHLICLSGKNGHGKSALLDAITWALWGQARKISNTAKADQGLLHLGQTQMMVIFDFLCNNQRYRIKREYAHTYGKPYAALEFGLINDEQSGFIPLTEKTIRTTQEKIEQTIHINFDTFINSAFLKQGSSNEFSKKSPKDRKEILAAILGLNHYEALRKRALEKAREYTFEKNNLLALNQKIESQLQEEPALVTELETIHAKLTHTTAQEQLLKEQVAALNARKKDIATQRNEHKITALKLEQLHTAFHQQVQALQETRAAWRAVAQKQRTTASKPLLEKQKQELLAQIDLHQKTVHQKLTLKDQYLQLQEQAYARKQAVHAAYVQQEQEKKLQWESCKHAQALLHEQLKQCTIAQEQLQGASHTVSKTIEELTTSTKSAVENGAHEQMLSAQFEKRKEHYHRFISQGKWHQAELEALLKKQELVQNEQDPACPLCEQNLSASRKRFLKHKFIEQERFLAHRIARLAQITKKLKELLLHQHTQLETIKKDTHAQQLLQITLAQHRTNHTQYQQELQVLEQKKKELETQYRACQNAALAAHQEWLSVQQEGSKSVEQDAPLAALAQQMQSIQKEIATLVCTQEEQEAVRAQLEQVEQQLSFFATLAQEEALQPKRFEVILRLCAELKRIKQEKARLQTALSADALLGQQEQELLHTEKQTLQALEQILKEKEALIHTKGSLEQRKKHLETVRAEHAQAIQKITKLEQTSAEFLAIAHATSKDGIQALLIEDAIPEIEQEANLLLSKLTDNQAHIMIESLRDLKKGGTKETLDIKISDSVGVRPYELFSGGEAFRIDFALRIAISKLLARRAGTSLQTIIIDEGFGSQDEEGLAHIMDAIYAIQEDFAKVIIVSHLPLMKEQFPVHFMVEKKAHGSCITVLEQG